MRRILREGGPLFLREDDCERWDAVATMDGEGTLSRVTIDAEGFRSVFEYGIDAERVILLGPSPVAASPERIRRDREEGIMGRGRYCATEDTPALASDGRGVAIGKYTWYPEHAACSRAAPRRADGCLLGR